MPWSFPFWQVLRFATLALMAGNGALLSTRPTSPSAPWPSSNCWRRPAPHLACSAPCWSVTRRVGEATERLITDPRLSAVTLTGSERAGAAVGAAAGRAHEKCVLELGGSDPFIVLADADLSNVADQIGRAHV